MIAAPSLKAQAIMPHLLAFFSKKGVAIYTNSLILT